MNRLDRVLHRVVVDQPGESRPPGRRRPEMLEPGERARPSTRTLAIAYLLAVLLPFATAAALVPFRVDHSRTAAVVLVVPVVLVAVRSATGPALTAALAAGLAYDVLLTAPYYHVAIDDPDDIIATVTLVVVALVVGVLSSRLVHVTARDTARRTELHHLLEFARTTMSEEDRGRVLADACDHLTEVLGLRGCRWTEAPHDSSEPILLPDGNVMGRLSALDPDRARLPDGIQLPATVGATEVGHFVLTPDPSHVSSFEERLTAATIAQLAAASLGATPVAPTIGLGAGRR